MSDRAKLDPDKLQLLALQVWGYKQGEVVAMMIHLGDRLGLYQAMAGAGRLTAAELAGRTALHERWLVEWLRSQAAAGLLESPDGDTFELTEEGAALLADEQTSTWFAAGAFQGGVAPPDVVDHLADSFRTGLGLSYDDLGPSAAHMVERMLGPWTRLTLVPQILPALDGVVDRLQRGVRVVDVGCGAGLALLAMGAAFPTSDFDGYDPSVNAIERAKANLVDAGLDNVTLHLAPAAALPDEPIYDFVITFDCVHDMPRPAEAIAAIRRAIKPDGTWLIKDIRSTDSWADSRRNPMLAMMYGTSVVSCLSSALSEPGGAGLGTLGFHPARAEQMCREGGFASFRIHDFGEPANLYYEVRP